MPEFQILRLSPATDTTAATALLTGARGRT